MATVFAARQEGPSGVARLVAVKILSAALSDDAMFQKMFLREARIAARLEHPNIVRVYDVGEASGEVYVAMEFVHGAPLSRLMAGAEPPPLGVALRIALDAARGLHAAHELTDVDGRPFGLVHQDVSPQNILVGYDGTSKLLDFGVAHLTTLDTSRVDGVRGKPAYLAPEQLQSGRVDRRTDLFALGIVLYELVTGTRLFQRATAGASLIAVMTDAAPDLRTLRPEAPARVAQAIARALERDPDRRFPTVEAMREELSAAAAAEGLDVGKAAVAAWARGVSPPTVTPSELEREILEGAADEQAAPLDVADLATLRPGRPPATAPAAETRGGANEARHRGTGRARSSSGVAILAAAGAVIAVSAWVGVSVRAKDRQLASVAQSQTPSAANDDPLPSASAAAADLEPQPTASIAASAAASTASAQAAAVSPPARSTATTNKERADSRALAAPSAATSSGSDPGAQPARIGVTASPWGRVTIDGVSVGDSPIPPREVAPGAHTVTIQNAQGEQRQTVVVKPGEKKQVVFTF